MSKGKITIERGKYKSIFNINNENVTINFEPKLPKENDENIIFVKNITSLLIEFLKG